jgi:hypothetical protein
MKKSIIVRPFCILVTFLLFHLQAYCQSWSAYNKSIDGPVYSLHNDSSRNELYFGGSFGTVGDKVVNYVAAMSDTNCIQLGMPMGSDNSMVGTNGAVKCMATFKRHTYMGGTFTTAESYNCRYVTDMFNLEFTSLGLGFNNTVRCVAIYKNELYAGGDFTASGTNTVNHIAKWDGKAWLAVGGGTDGNVETMLVHKGNLIIAGDFETSGNAALHHIAKWDGSNLTALGDGITASKHMDSLGLPAVVSSLCIYQGQLYAGGRFQFAGNASATNIAKWNETDWAAVGTVGTRSSDIVKCMAVYNNRMMAGGMFDKVDMKTMNNISAWDGTTWTALGSGVDNSIEALTIFNYNLIAAGTFQKAGGISSAYMAQWREHTSGIKSENTSDAAFLAYPNPTSGTIELQIKSPGEASSCTVSFTDYLGRAVKSKTINSSTGVVSFDIENAPDGIYFMTVTNGSGTETKKILLNRK